MANSIVDKDSNSLRYQHLHAVLGFIPAGVAAGLIVYTVMSLTFISARISIPYSVLSSIIVFSIANYYHSGQNSSSTITITIKRIRIGVGKATLSVTTLAFTLTFLAFLIILIVDQKPSENAIFTNWNNLMLSDLFHLTAAIAISIYLPGFALISILDRENQIIGLGKHMLGYLFSIFISGAIGLAIAASGQPFRLYSTFVIILYILILALFLIVKMRRSYNRYNINGRSVSTDNDRTIHSSRKIVLGNYWVYIVFASLVTFVILSSYYLFGTTLVGDQLYHHGRAMTFLDGSFRTLALNGMDVPYLPFMHGFLASVFSLSGIPSVNVYISLGFLNIIPVIAFYYFFSRWFPFRQKSSNIRSVLIYDRFWIWLGSYRIIGK